MPQDAIVTAEWLAANLDDPRVKVADASFYLPIQRRNAREEFEDSHIPGAVFFDIEEICDKNAKSPHMLPSPEEFARMMGEFGFSNQDHIIVYDGTGFASAAARVWWMFKVFGHDKVSVLDGGLPQWFRGKNSTEDGEATPTPAVFVSNFRPHLVRSIEQMRANITSKEEQVLDARSLGRFKGADPEMWPVKRSGHIPGSLNLPFLIFIDDKFRTLLPMDQIKEKIRASGAYLDKPTVATCGSGVTACVLALAYYLLDGAEVAIYDGSWAEWGNAENAPAELG